MTVYTCGNCLHNVVRLLRGIKHRTKIDKEPAKGHFYYSADCKDCRQEGRECRNPEPMPESIRPGMML